MDKSAFLSSLPWLKFVEAEVANSMQKNSSVCHTILTDGFCCFEIDKSIVFFRVENDEDPAQFRLTVRYISECKTATKSAPALFFLIDNNNYLVDHTEMASLSIPKPSVDDSKGPPYAMIGWSGGVFMRWWLQLDSERSVAVENLTTAIAFINSSLTSEVIEHSLELDSIVTGTTDSSDVSMDLAQRTSELDSRPEEHAPEHSTDCTTGARKRPNDDHTASPVEYNNTEVKAEQEPPVVIPAVVTDPSTVAPGTTSASDTDDNVRAANKRVKRTTDDADGTDTAAGNGESSSMSSTNAVAAAPYNVSTAAVSSVDLPSLCTGTHSVGSPTDHWARLAEVLSAAAQTTLAASQAAEKAAVAATAAAEAATAASSASLSASAAVTALTALIRGLSRQNGGSAS